MAKMPAPKKKKMPLPFLPKGKVKKAPTPVPPVAKGKPSRQVAPAKKAVTAAKKGLVPFTKKPAAKKKK